MQVEYRDVPAVRLDTLPDDSRTVDSTRDAVIAAAVLSSGYGISSVEGEVTEELVEKAIQQLRERKLVTASLPFAQTTRRQ
jgi:hypothetical protein